MSWNKRYRRLQEIAKGFDTVELLKGQLELETLKLTKDLSFGERKILSVIKSKLDGSFQTNVIPIGIKQ